jgi:hypothetical protein
MIQGYVQEEIRLYLFDRDGNYCEQINQEYFLIFSQKNQAIGLLVLINIH